MKKAALLHGTDGTPSDHWFPWMKSELENRGYEVFAPQLPECHTPNREAYEAFLRESNWDFTDNILVGHSSGATTVLNLLSADWFPRVRASVLVGTFLNEKLTKTADWYEAGQFDNLFLEIYDPDVIKNRCDNFIFVHGSNDPYCDAEDARKHCSELDGKFIEIESGHHLGDSAGVTELLGLMAQLEPLL